MFDLRISFSIRAQLSAEDEVARRTKDPRKSAEVRIWNGRIIHLEAVPQKEFSRMSLQSKLETDSSCPVSPRLRLRQATGGDSRMPAFLVSNFTRNCSPANLARAESAGKLPRNGEFLPPCLTAKRWSVGPVVPKAFGHISL